MKKEWMDKILAPQPLTLVDRLNGIYIYPTSTSYGATAPVTNAKPSPLNVEAANEIEFLRNLIAKFNINVDEYRPNQN